VDIFAAVGLDKVLSYGELASALGSYWKEHPGELTALLDRAEASLNGRS